MGKFLVGWDFNQGSLEGENMEPLEHHMLMILAD